MPLIPDYLSYLSSFPLPKEEEARRRAEEEERERKTELELLIAKTTSPAFLQRRDCSCGPGNLSAVREHLGQKMWTTGGSERSNNSGEKVGQF
jgi:hypothetical protein